MGKSLFKCIGKPRWLNLFLNKLFLKAVPHFSTSYIIREINKLFNGHCLISLKFLGNEILEDKVLELVWKTFSHMGKSLFQWLNIFQNNSASKPVPQVSTNFIIKVINKVFNGLCFISLKFQGDI